MALTVDDITKLAELVSRERLDALEYDGLKLRITKTMHAPIVLPRAVSKTDDDDEDIETWSAK